MQARRIIRKSQYNVRLKFTSSNIYTKIYEILLTRSIDRWLVPITQENPKSKSKCPRLRFGKPHQLTLAYMKNNQAFVSYLYIYIAINMCLFISRAIQYRASNGFVIVARACG